MVYYYYFYYDVHEILKWKKKKILQVVIKLKIFNFNLCPERTDVKYRVKIFICKVLVRELTLVGNRKLTFRLMCITLCWWRFQILNLEKLLEVQNAKFNAAIEDLTAKLAAEVQKRQALQTQMEKLAHCITQV